MKKIIFSLLFCIIGLIFYIPNAYSQSDSYVIAYNYTSGKIQADNNYNYPAINPSTNASMIFQTAIKNVISSGHGGISVSGDEFDFKKPLIIPPTFSGFYFHTQPDTIFDLENHGDGMVIDSANRCDIQLGILQGDFGDNTTGIHIYPHGFNARGQSDFVDCHISYYSIRDFNTLIHFDATSQNIYQVVLDHYADMDNAFSVPITKNATGLLFDGKHPNFIQNIKLNLNYIFPGNVNLFCTNCWWTGLKVGNSTFNNYPDVDGLHLITEGFGGNNFVRSILIDTYGSQGIYDVQLGDANYGLILEPKAQDNVLYTTEFYNIYHPITSKTTFHNNVKYDVTGYAKIS